MHKVLALNGSPRKNKITSLAVKNYAEYLINKLNHKITTNYQHIDIDPTLQPCLNCKTCAQGCIDTNDNFREILEAIRTTNHIILGTPVYLDTPTPQVMALLHRLNCMAESTKREFFRDKNIYLLATAYCSGTKSAISIMMRSCEMLGFTIPGRSTREYIHKWDDSKLRGGMDPILDAIVISECL